MRPLVRSVLVAWLCGSALALAANGGIGEDHVALISILGGSLLGLFALGAGLRQWIVTPAIEKQSAAQREDWHELRDEILTMLHRIDNSASMFTSRLDGIDRSLSDLWKEHDDAKATCWAAQRDPAASQRRRRSTDSSGSDFTDLRGHS